MPRVASYFLPIALAVSVGSEVRADAVTESLKLAMKECVSANAERIGSPVKNTDLWSRVIAGTTATAYSMIKISGTGDQGLQAAMIAQTGDFLVSSLEEKGFRDFRSQTLETVEYCMPFGLVAAANEIESQENAACPDDTGYKDHVKNLLSSDSDLADTYGSAAKSIRDLTPFLIKVDFYNSFPEIFYYGNEDHPSFDQEGRLQDVHEALIEIDSENISDIHPLVEEALAATKNLPDRSDGLLTLQRELTCIKDWLDIYPSEEIAELENDKSSSLD